MIIITDMKKSKKGFGVFLWPLVFAALVLAADQILVRIPLNAPGLREVQVFYRDFRQRLLALPQTAKKPTTAAPAADTRTAPKSKPSGLSAPVPPSPPSAPLAGRTPVRPAPAIRYVYADAQGNLQFAESLDEIPANLRREAKPLAP